jgi:ATP-dependent helicase/nuclease subunit B
MAELGTGILDGDTKINPYEKGRRNGCEFCIYRPVCGFDEKIPGYRRKRLKELKTEEIWGLVEKAVETEEATMREEGEGLDGGADMDGRTEESN